VADNSEKQKFEIFANQLNADAAATRTILQCLLVSMFGSHADGTKLLEGLRTNALANLVQSSSAEFSNQDAARFQQATRRQTEQFFEDMRPVFPQMTSAPKDAN
jgi:hypothetical protein